MFFLKYPLQKLLKDYIYNTRKDKIIYLDLQSDVEKYKRE